MIYSVLEVTLRFIFAPLTLIVIFMTFLLLPKYAEQRYVTASELARDHRPPVLYLRPFTYDDVTSKIVGDPLRIALQIFKALIGIRGDGAHVMSPEPRRGRQAELCPGAGRCA